MTTKTIKTILFASLLVAMILPFSGMDFAEAESNKIGKTEIKTEKKQNTVMNNAAEKLSKLQEKLDTSSNDKQKQNILDQMERVKEHAVNKLQKIDEKRQASYDKLTDKLTDNISDISKNGQDKRIIPAIKIGYDSLEDALVVTIEPGHSSEEMEQYATFVRSVVGEEADIVLVEGETWNSSSCNSRSSNCNPIEGGVRMQVTDHGPCTVGFKATYNGDSGFVTAGHCADGNTGDDVGQSSLSNVVGEVRKETFYQGSSTYCDCAFVETTTTVDSDIFGISSSYQPDHTHTVKKYDWVKMSGQVSGIKTGYVTNWSDSVYMSNLSTWVRHVATATYSSTEGDSGAPVLQAYESDPGFTGINVAFSTSESAFVKHYKFTSYFSGLQWGF